MMMAAIYLFKTMTKKGGFHSNSLLLKKAKKTAAEG